MKKLLLLSFFAASFTLTANTTFTNTTISESDSSVVDTQEMFFDIEKKEVPNAVRKGISSNFKGYSIGTVSVNKDKTVYKLELSKGEEDSITILVDNNGNVISKGIED